MMSPSVVIIILNYNNAPDTIECLKSLNNCEYDNFKIIVIDNFSTDNSYHEIKKQFPELKIVQTGKNLGYTGGVNFGIQRAVEDNCKYILLLNNDTIVEKNFLTVLVNALENDPTAAAATGLILAEHDRNLIWYAGGKLIKWRGIARHEYKMKSIKTYKGINQKYVSFISGCMILLRTEYIFKIGYQDEKFFMYLDDIEYSARIQNHGYKMIYHPKSIIYHKVLNEKESLFKLYYSVRNRLLLINTITKGFTKLIASCYFLSIILFKIVIWFFINHKFYRAALYGLVDFKNKNFYEGRGLSTFLN